jgi:WXG100 protein secretion system (Wss), protein YukD
MGAIVVDIMDETGNRRESVQLPDDVPVNRIIVKLVEKLGMPVRDATGNRMLVYKLHHSAAGQLRDEETLAGAGVRDFDLLRLYGEMIAGAGQGRPDGRC